MHTGRFRGATVYPLRCIVRHTWSRIYAALGESPAVDFIDLIDYSVWEEAWVDSLREAFELSE